ncbi:hypothetical protein OIU77_015907 [Salix suchowensis]|uniref:Uncharacterized protein n=1 Tax=Salix suchowensis TaxID=1278906 RepID=A0ABQ8ZIS0_9ROSI|nr:hypothetical protein OIU77_015907 [Salix suchowensis]
MATLYLFSALLLTVVVSAPINVSGSAYCGPVEATDKDLVQFPLNLEFLEAEFFLNSALGHGLDAIEPDFCRRRSASNWCPEGQPRSCYP